MKTPFSTVRTEGGLLPVDLLQRIATGKDLAGLRPEDYHLAANERLNEAISRSWNRLLGVWQSFQDQQEKLPEGDRGTTLTRERWLLILFQELGYGRLPYIGGLETDDGERYPISHRWGQTPIHLITFRQELDRRDPSIRRTPHGMVQELLNRSDRYLWGILSNGLRLRLLRDNASLSRAAYVEFDLKGMMQGEIYSDFVLLWLVAHQSRVEVGESKDPTDCWLERWVQEARETGARALDALRDGVQQAIIALGRGFLAWRRGNAANRHLRQRLTAGELGPQDYYRQLLRLVYRLIFLFVAEDRNLLLRPDASVQVRERYLEYYSARRLRRLAEVRRGGPHPDLYRTLRLVFDLLGQGYEPLGLPGLGGFLFSNDATPDLNLLDIANRDFLDAVRALAFVVSDGVRWPVDYRNLGSEELGSVYESLLELHPRLDLAADHFDLHAAAGSERKTTGSYYTPTSLINELLDSALEPVIQDRLQSAWRIAQGEWRTANGEWTISHQERTHVHIILSRSGRMAAGHEGGRAGIRPDSTFSDRREIRDDLPDTAGGGLDSGQHRGGMGAALPGGAHPVSSPGQRQPHRTGNPSSAERGRGAMSTGEDAQSDGGTGHSGQAVGGPGTQSTKEQTEINGEATRRIYDAWMALPFATRHSQLAEAMLLDIKVLDPAAGSGHFLIAAAHRLAGRLARIRNQDQEPSPDAHRAALRDVVRHCIYGVDMNPMAVELCKVGLWLESLDPGKPLSFLDRNIQCGNSLVGVSPGLDISIIPDDAFKPVTGDDRTTATALRRRNRRERRGHRSFLAELMGGEEIVERESALIERLAEVEAIPEEDLADVALKAMYYQDYLASPAYRRKKDEYDLWTAAFFWPIPAGDAELMDAPTQAVLDSLRARWNPADPVLHQARAIAAENRFFHWELAFPTVFGRENPGFDVVLGNPPWERIKLQEKEWFATRRPDIANAPNRAARQRLIQRLQQEDPELYATFQRDKARAENMSLFVRNSRAYPLCGRGDVNTYALFAELNTRLMNIVGRVGVIVPTGIATDDTTKYFFQALMENRALVSLYDFENRKKLFPAVHRSYKFCLLTLRGSRDAGWRFQPRHAASAPGSSPPPADFLFFAQDVADLRDEARHFALTAEEIALLNPNTRTCPIFRSQRDAELTKAIYRRVPVLIVEEQKDVKGRVIRPEQNPWGVSFLRMIDMANDSHLFRTQAQLEAQGYRLAGNWFVKGGEGRMGSGQWQEADVYLPLYEAKMFHHFDHRWARYAGDKIEDIPLQAKTQPDALSQPRYWIHASAVAAKLPETQRNWLLSFRDICRSTDERTAIFSTIPAVAVSNKAPILLSDHHILLFPYLQASLSSLPFDYATRQSIGGTSLNFYIVKQLPVLPPETYAQPCPWAGHASRITHHAFLLPRVLELTYTAWDLAPFGRELITHWQERVEKGEWQVPPGETDPRTLHPSPLATRHSLFPPFRWDEERRFLLRCELDAAYFHLYGIARDDAAYIMDTFPIVRRKDEAAHGDYRTKRVILAIYDAMAEAAASGEPYRTLLDPPPAHPAVAHVDRPPEWVKWMCP